MVAENPLIRIVVVDDAESLRFMLRLLLEMDGRFDLLGEAGDGREALAVLDALHADGCGVDLLLLDVEMPEMNGLEVLDAIADRDHIRRVVILSGVSDVLGREQALARGAWAYLEKDAAPHELADRLAGLHAEPARATDPGD